MNTTNQTENLTIQQQHEAAKETERKQQQEATLAASAAAKAAAKAKKTTGSKKEVDKNLLPIVVKRGKDEVTEHEDASKLKNLPSFIGYLVSLYKTTFGFYIDFPANKQKLIVPAATGGKGEKERISVAFSNLAKVLFEGKERDEIVKDKATIATLQTFQAKNFHFACYSFAAVSAGLQVKINRQLEHIKLQQDATKELKPNKAMISETSTIKDVRKVMKKEGIEAAKKYVIELKAQKLLPEMV
jgi:hypothetical protein